MNDKIQINLLTKNTEIKLKDPAIKVAVGGGSFEPTGTYYITENGEYNVKYYATANVNVPIPEGYIVPEGTFSAAKVGTYDVTNYAAAEFSVETETKEFTPTEEEQNYQPDEDIYITSVKVNPIPEQYIVPSGNIDIADTNSVDVTQYSSAQIKDENLKAENIAENVEILGITGTFRGGIDTSDGDVTADDILAGKVAYAKEERIVGTIQDYDGGNSESLTPNEDFNAILSNEVLESYTNNFVKVIAPYKFRDGQLKRFNSTSCITLGGQSFYNSIIEECNTPNVQSVGSSTFQGCTYLKKVYFPNNNSAVSSTAFAGCVSMTYAHIGRTPMINNYAFQNCSALKTIIITSTSIPSLSTKDVFTGTPIIDGTGYIYVLDELVESYKSSTNWSIYASQIKPLNEYEEVE